MNDEQKEPGIPPHPFTNTYEDRDCVVCGKPKAAHDLITQAVKAAHEATMQQPEFKRKP